ncbi:GNAT family N-acetyltransferase [Nonomuraea sp. CA-218870]|uniref:GNAT family N-acetyltransferase n=1 Tax=Nonomuraea sp. CA-218870 TaxID=3239998 RepID=UPI003D8B1862
MNTERLALRPLTPDDADEIVRLHNDPDVMRFLNGGKPTPRETIVRETLPRMTTTGFFAALERSTGAFVGWFLLRPSAENGDELELGYRLHRAFWGHGYATEGSLLLIERAFAELGARRVYAQTMTVNRGSRRVMEKCGLRYVRTFWEDWDDPIDGSEQGEVEYELLREEWEASRSAGPPGVLV